MKSIIQEKLNIISVHSCESVAKGFGFYSIRVNDKRATDSTNIHESGEIVIAFGRAI